MSIKVTCPVCRGTGSNAWDPIVPEESPRCWLCKGVGNVSRHRIPLSYRLTAEWVLSVLNDSKYEIN